MGYQQLGSFAGQIGTPPERRAHSRLVGLDRDDHPQYGNEWVLLGQAVADGTSGTLLVADIPQVYHDLHVSWRGGNDGTVVTALLRLSEDTSASYRRSHVTITSAGAVGGSGATGQTGVAISTINVPSPRSGGTIRIPAYWMSGVSAVPFFYESWNSAGGSDSASRQGSGFLITHDPVTAVQIDLSSTNWASGSVLSVYGAGRRQE